MAIGRKRLLGGEVTILIQKKKRKYQLRHQERKSAILAAEREKILNLNKIMMKEKKRLKEVLGQGKGRMNIVVVEVAMITNDEGGSKMKKISKRDSLLPEGKLDFSSLAMS